MRYRLLFIILLGLDFPVVAQEFLKDRKAVEAQIDAFIRSWNRHDFSDMKNYVADDCDFVNVVGMHWKGREEIQYAHQAYHEKFFKNTPMEKLRVTVRFLKPDVAIVHLLWHIGAFTPPDGSVRGDNDDLATIVLVKRNGRWMITAVENVEVSADAEPFDPIKMQRQ